SAVGGVAVSSWPVVLVVVAACDVEEFWVTVDDCVVGFDVGTVWQAARTTTNSGRVKNTRIDNLSY
ncbi:MAG: hypothetical protein ACKOA0_14740, partial [Burkholderiaceae bacterium]